MLNLLIAILGNTYSRIASHEKVQMQFERARCIYEIERHFMPDFVKRYNKFFPRMNCFFIIFFLLFHNIILLLNYGTNLIENLILIFFILFMFLQPL